LDELQALRIIYSFNACFEVPSGIHDSGVSFLIAFLKVTLIRVYFQALICSLLEAEISSFSRTGVYTWGTEPFLSFCGLFNDAVPLYGI
jgi:hypothetical protein